MNVSLNSLFQMAGGSGNTKVSNMKNSNFDTFMKSSTAKETATISKSTQSGVSASMQNKETMNTTEQTVGETVKSTDVGNSTDVNETEEIPVLKEENVQKSVAGDKNLEETLGTVKTFLEQLKETIQNIIKKDMDLDDNDIEKVLEQMGLNMIDLLDISNLQQFVLQNAGEEISGLLTNETLANQFNQLLTDVDEMCMELEDNLNISKSDIRVLSTMVENEQAFQNVLEGSESNVEFDDNKLSSLLKNLDTMLEGSDLKDNVMEGLNTNNIEHTEKQENSDLKQAQYVSSEDGFITVETEDIQKDASHSEQRQSDKGQQTDETAVTHFVQELVHARTEIEETAFSQTEQLQQMREIVTQVVEQIKIVIKADTSAMEIQLNPEKLGKVNLSVVSKNGQMTANFVTENEMAKTALESQMQQLKDTLQEQGLKVDAIEVSVSDFRFEQSSNKNDEQQRQPGSDKKKSPRKIDLSMLEDGFDDLSEEDTIAAKVMIDNGNTVDYTA